MPDLMSPLETYRRPRDRADTTDTAFDDRPWLGRQLGVGSSSQDLTPQPRRSLIDPNAEQDAHWRYTQGSPWEASKGAQRAEAILGAPGVNEMLFASNFIAPRPGAAMMPTPAPKPQGIRAFHGSPHEFERFDMGKIGTGEGAQAYGRGLYFAENEGVARSYRDALSPAKTTTTVANMFDSQHLARSALSQNQGRMAAENQLVQNLAEARGRASFTQPATPEIGAYAERLVAGLEEALQLVRDNKVAAPPSAGHMYEVNINANPERFLNWDKPLSQQNDKVRASVRQYMNLSDGSKMADIGWKNISDRPAGEAIGESLRAETTTLREAGVAGIEYKDAKSRGFDGGGTSNYVVFDDKLIEILRKYGLAGLMAGGTAATQSPGLLSPSAQSPNN